jgi:hypothetical protein
MIRIFLQLFVCTATLIGSPSFLLAQKSPRWEDPLPTTENAALVYWQAIALIPKANPEQQALFDHSDGLQPDAVAAKEVFAASGPAMRVMRRAAALKQCDWGTNRNDGPGALMPHASKVRELTRMAMFRVLFQARSGDLDAAVNDGLAILGLARHMSFNELMIGTLTGYALEAQGVKVLAEVVPQLTPAQLRNLAQRHADLPPRPPIRESILLEKRAFLGWFARATKAGRINEVLEVIAAMGGTDQAAAVGGGDQVQKRVDTPWLAKLRVEATKNPDTLMKLIHDAAQSYDEGAHLIDLPPEVFWKKSAEWEARLKEQAHPVTLILLTPVSNYYAARLRVEARRAVMQAGIAYVLEGDTGLRKHPEPSTGMQFTLKKTATGFELHANLPDPVNQPLVVTFGRPPAAE